MIQSKKKGEIPEDSRVEMIVMEEDLKEEMEEEIQILEKEDEKEEMKIEEKKAREIERMK